MSPAAAFPRYDPGLARAFAELIRAEERRRVARSVEPAAPAPLAADAGDVPEREEPAIESVP